MQDEPETLTKRVIDGWVMSYHRGAGWYGLYSAPIIGINRAAQDYWLRQNDVSDGPTDTPKENV